MDSKQFKTIRLSLGNQFQVAAILGVSQGQISIWELGYRPIPKDIADHMEDLKEEVTNG